MKKKKALSEMLSPKETQILIDMIAKRDYYLDQRRLHEANGATEMIRIYWDTMIGFEDNSAMPNTDFPTYNLGTRSADK